MKPRNHKAEFMDIMGKISNQYYNIVQSIILFIGVVALVYILVYSVKEKLRRDQLIEKAAQTIIQQNNNQ